MYSVWFLEFVLDMYTLIFYYACIITLGGAQNMRTLPRWEPFRGATSLQDQVNRHFSDVFERKGEESSLPAGAPSLDIYEPPHQPHLTAHLPAPPPNDLPTPI